MPIESYWFDSPLSQLPGRQVDVLLPAGYTSSDAPYPFLVMHDGQNCLGNDAYGHGGWQLDNILAELTGSGVVVPMIAILVHCNSENRLTEYSPKPWTYVGEKLGGLLPLHQRWLMETVLPALQMRYPLSTLPEDIGIGGSSMGGIAAFDTAFRFAPCFGKLMVMSSPFRLCADGACFKRLKKKQRPKKIYLDAGTEFEKVPGDFSEDTREMADSLVKAGYLPGETLQFRIAEGDAHDEAHWRKRLPDALTFLFGKTG